MKIFITDSTYWFHGSSSINPNQYCWNLYFI